MKCRLCGKEYPESEMSEEHYPAHSVGNDDIVQLDLIAMIDSLMSGELKTELIDRKNKGESIEEIANDLFDNRLSNPIYPKGRTARTLCRSCNTFLGKYDEAYLKFYKIDGDCKSFKGFQRKTKIEVIKSIYGKFLSVPETSDEEFDFIDFIEDESTMDYHGAWRLYIVRRDMSSDLFGLTDLRTGKATFDEGVVYEMSDEKFLFFLMNFEKHECIKMTNMFEILEPHFQIITGVGENGGYHAQILISSLLSEDNMNEN